MGFLYYYYVRAKSIIYSNSEDRNESLKRKCCLANCVTWSKMLSISLLRKLNPEKNFETDIKSQILKIRLDVFIVLCIKQMCLANDSGEKIKGGKFKVVIFYYTKNL